MQVGLKMVVAGHLVPLAPFLMEAHPKTAVLRVDVFDLHAHSGPDACEREYHERDQRAIP